MDEIMQNLVADTVSRVIPSNIVGVKKTSLKKELSAADIDFIMANTTFKKDHILKWYDEFSFRCPDLKLDKPQFVHFYRKLMPGDNEAEEAFCEFMFEAFDNDRNGFIDFGEFLIAFWIRCDCDLKCKLEWLFDLYDADNTSFISFWELYMMLRLIFIMKQIKDDPYDKTFYIMNLFDRSHDGTITKLEFVSACTTNEYLKKLFSPLVLGKE